jgi:adenosylhomocysteine nucleosidase
MTAKRAAAALFLAVWLSACGGRDAAAPARSASTPRPVVVQGAMDVEIRKLAGRLEHATETNIHGWTVWTGTFDGYPAVVSKTLKGMENTAAATYLVADRYDPIAIINQGTAGGHVPDVHVFDIVLGTDAINLGSFKTPIRARGQGSDVAEWEPLDLLRSEGSAGQDPNARTMRRFHADDGLLAAARHARNLYQRGRVVEGVIGSSEVWNSELDRIERFHAAFGTTVEEMETASAAQIAASFHIPFLGIRIVSNNITNGGTYDGKTGEACQDYVYDVVKSYVSTRNGR